MILTEGNRHIGWGSEVEHRGLNSALLPAVLPFCAWLCPSLPAPTTSLPGLLRTGFPWLSRSSSWKEHVTSCWCFLLSLNKADRLSEECG